MLLKQPNRVRWRSAGILFLAGLTPLLLSAVMLAPNFVLTRRVELFCARTPTGVMCEERAWGLFGSPALRHYGPVLEFANAFLPVVQPADEPQRNEKLSTLAVRTTRGEFHPFAGLASSPLPPSMLVVSSEVAQAVSSLTPLLNDVSAAPVMIRRSDPYPIGFIAFDVLACLTAVASLLFWTPPLWRGAWLHWRGAPAQEAAQPLLQLMERIVHFVLAMKQDPRDSMKRSWLSRLVSPQDERRDAHASDRDDV